MLIIIPLDFPSQISNSVEKPSNKIPTQLFAVFREEKRQKSQTYNVNCQKRNIDASGKVLLKKMG